MWTDCYLQESKAFQALEINICDKQTVTSTIFNESAIDDADGDGDGGGDGDADGNGVDDGDVWRWE